MSPLDSETLSPQHLLADHGAQPTRPSDLALFDFDGTLTTCETFPIFVKRALSKSKLRAGWLRLWPLVLGYRMGLVSGVRVRAAIVRVGFKDHSVEALERAGAAFAKEFLPTAMRPEMVARLEWHRARGDRVVIVSGGLGAYLRPWADAQGLELLCSELAERDGICTGGFAGAQCVSAEKARRVCLSLDLNAYSCVHAYGDTPEDADLLALADEVWYRGQRGYGKGARA